MFSSLILRGSQCTNMHIDRTLITHNTNKSHLKFLLVCTPYYLHYIIYYEDTIILHSNSVRISDIISSTVYVKGTQIQLSGKNIVFILPYTLYSVGIYIVFETLKSICMEANMLLNKDNNNI